MKRNRQIGEGVLLGVILIAMTIGTMIFVRIGEVPYSTIEPVHSLDIIITQPPKVNINTADVETISTLTGIGDVIAQRIIDWREENGPIQNFEELLEIPGIGEAKLEGIREEICID